LIVWPGDEGGIVGGEEEDRAHQVLGASSRWKARPRRFSCSTRLGHRFGGGRGDGEARDEQDAPFRSHNDVD
jgi:hypothetical protein